ncbi:hypothetical protein CXG81DRAFT_27488 [Caulochytrium protostelioides]|uniref:Metallo-beta-lactamase domain-containing protein n=1 Tax=Caulochytrium protostelioides TaxID=1555241 RepID=A0A4P9X421_9FUNG|nr:hypothetical protein CXG81DRAFT_27488 [Caulochytrium protostelioides]|eukprot:RKO99771.1 hypothetical protein CXG81DRAFT_27488 [Caulochytrium protostelioides]
MRVKIVSMFKDNYAYLLTDAARKATLIVDPAEPAAIRAAWDAAVKQGAEVAAGPPAAILCTHHHRDHAGGNTALRQQLGIPDVVGEARAEAVTLTPTHRQVLRYGDLEVTALHTGGHTMGHVCYYVTDTGAPTAPPAVFTGDCLFVGGCGRFFEGTPDDMYTSLIERLARLPDATQVYCGHEYTAANLRFGQSVEPGNEALSAKLAALPACTVPSTIGEEKATNVFLRVETSEELQQRFKMQGRELLGALRATKDKF